MKDWGGWISDLLMWFSQVQPGRESYWASLSLSFSVCLSVSHSCTSSLIHQTHTLGTQPEWQWLWNYLVKDLEIWDPSHLLPLPSYWNGFYFCIGILISLITFIHYRTPINSDTFDCKWSYHLYLLWLYKNVTHFTIETIRLFDFYLKRFINKVA